MKFVVVFTSFAVAFSDAQFTKGEIVVTEIQPCSKFHLVEATSHNLHYWTGQIDMNSRSTEQGRLRYHLILARDFFGEEDKANQQYADKS